MHHILRFRPILQPVIGDGKQPLPEMRVQRVECFGIIRCQSFRPSAQVDI